jgi:flagellar motor switch protein FliG
MKKPKRGIDAYRAETEKTGFLKLTEDQRDYGKIARFLLLLGEEDAGKVLKHLPDNEVRKISGEISRTDRVDKVEAEKLLRDFGFDSEREAHRARGGVDAAADILNRAFGREEGERYLRQAVPDSVEGPFSFLNDLTFEQLKMLLKEESEQVVALVLRYLDPALSSKVISHLGKKQSTAVIKRIAKGGSVSMEVIAGMEESLKEKIRTQGEVETREIDGTSALAGILKYMNIEDEQKILASLADENEIVSRNVKEKLFTIDTVLHIERNDLQKILTELKESEIALILRVVDGDVQKKIRASLSSGQKIMVDEEDELIGKVPLKEADRQVREFLSLLRKREEEGVFTVMREEEDYL